MYLLNKPLILSIQFKFKCYLLGQSFGSMKLSCVISIVSYAGRGQSAWESGSQLL